MNAELDGTQLRRLRVASQAAVQRGSVARRHAKRGWWLAWCCEVLALLPGRACRKPWAVPRAAIGRTFGAERLVRWAMRRLPEVHSVIEDDFLTTENQQH